jgi:hypothetical protein
MMAMNRRNFIGGVIAAASSSSFTGAMRAENSLAGTSDAAAPDRDWMKRGFIDAGGSHEPYIFIVRRGGQRLDARQTYDYQQSEELISQLHRSGVEVFHTHLYKGFGMEAEREEMDQARKAVSIAHRLGMKADTYIQWNSMMYETFFAEEPRAVDWVQRDAAGAPVMLPYGFQQSFRYCPCFNNQDYLAYLKKVVRYAIIEVKTDFIHFDNFGFNAEPDSCHCPACTEGFRKHLKKKYTPAQLRQRFGFERVDFVNPPRWNRNNTPDKMEIIYDPAFQEWIDFRCQTMADALEQMHDYAVSLNPDIALEINPGGITGRNITWESGVDHSRLLKFTKAFWSEEEGPVGYSQDGQFVSKIRSYKLARAYSNTLLAYIENDALAFCESLAFNQTPGFVGVAPLSTVSADHVEFYLQNRHLYDDTEGMANVGVLRSYASLTYNNAAVQLSTELAEQALIEGGVPFDLLFDDKLHDLAKYKVLILPNCECLSDTQLSLLRDYVERGGALVVVGETGLFDEWRRVRVTPGLQGMVDGQQSALGYQQEVTSRGLSAGGPARKIVGRGRVGFIPAMVIDGTTPPQQPYFPIGKEFWKRPANWSEFLDLVQWASEDQVPIRLKAPRGIAINYTGQPSKQHAFIHVLNYDRSTLGGSSPIEIEVRLPNGARLRKSTVHAPGSKNAQEISFENTGPLTRFTLPNVKTYSVIMMEW